MIFKLEKEEIRKVLAEHLGRSASWEVNPDPDECWFEVEAGVRVIEGEKVDDIHNVRFCYRESTRLTSGG